MEKVLEVGHCVNVEGRKGGDVVRRGNVIAGLCVRRRFRADRLSALNYSFPLLRWWALPRWASSQDALPPKSRRSSPPL